MLRWTMIMYRVEITKNEYVIGSIGVISIADKMRKSKLKWSEDVLKRKETKIATVVKRSL